MNKKIVIYAAATLFIVGCCSAQQAKGVSIPFSSPSANIVKAMSFNIRVDTFLDGFNGWDNRKQLVFDTLKIHAADVMGLQEALAHQVQQIQQTLPRYNHYAAGRKDGREKGESCAIFYRKDRFTPGECGTFWFSDTPSKPGSKDWGNLWPRICSWIYLTEKSTGRGFYVYNVHLDVLSQKSREKSVELLAQRIASRKIPAPFIVMGDFNMGLDNPAMVYLQNVNSRTPYPKMVDAWQSIAPASADEGTHHNFRGKTSGPKIDHIPLSENLQALEVQIDRRSEKNRYPSDHFPVIAKILFAPSPKIPLSTESLARVIVDNKRAGRPSNDTKRQSVENNQASNLAAGI
jgi:endonuclease/exonuclease/phosphatase family metal-dependent hydrolase